MSSALPVSKHVSWKTPLDDISAHAHAGGQELMSSLESISPLTSPSDNNNSQQGGRSHDIIKDKVPPTLASIGKPLVTAFTSHIPVHGNYAWHDITRINLQHQISKFTSESPQEYIPSSNKTWPNNIDMGVTGISSQDASRPHTSLLHVNETMTFPTPSSPHNIISNADDPYLSYNPWATSIQDNIKSNKNTQNPQPRKQYDTGATQPSELPEEKIGTKRRQQDEGVSQTKAQRIRLPVATTVNLEYPKPHTQNTMHRGVRRVIQPARFHLQLKNLPKSTVVIWANTLKSIEFVRDWGKFDDMSQKRLDSLLSTLDANKAHPQLTKKILHEVALDVLVRQVMEQDYHERSRGKAKEIYTFWKRHSMLDEGRMITGDH